MDKLRVYWPLDQVLFHGKGIGEAWRDEFLRVAPYELADKPDDADIAFFYSDSVLDLSLVGKLPTVQYHWGFYHQRFLDPQYNADAYMKAHAMSQCTFLLASSYITQYQLYQAGVESIFLPAGIDTALFDSVPQRIPLQRKMQVLFLSRLVPHKRLEMLIEALSVFEPRIPLVVSGPGDIAPYQDLARSLNVPVTFVQYTDTEKVYALRESMLLVHPSEYEGFSLPPLEALYCNTPVIVSDIPQHRHLLQNSALYFYNREELSEKLLLVLKNYAQAQQLVEIGKTLVEENYTLKLASERLVNIFHEAIRKHLGERLQKHPEDILDIYNKDHKRHWVHNTQYMDPNWFRHWRMQHVLKNLVGKSVLDVGGATGVYTVGIAQRGYQVTWFDHSQQALLYAQELCLKYQVSAKFELGDAHKLPFEDASFDTVWAGEIIEHVFAPAEGVAEIVRVAKQRAILSTPIGEHHMDPLHINRWNDKNIAALFAPYRHTIEKIAEEGTEESCFFIVVEK